MWVLELDSCIMSPDIVKHICNINVNQDLTLPADHTSVSIVINTRATNLDSLVTRALRLGDHPVWYSKQSKNLMKKKQTQI